MAAAAYDAHVAAVLHGCRSPTAFRTGAAELDDLRATLSGRRTLCARVSMPTLTPPVAVDVRDRRCRRHPASGAIRRPCGAVWPRTVVTTPPRRHARIVGYVTNVVGPGTSLGCFGAYRSTKVCCMSSSGQRGSRNGQR